MKTNTIYNNTKKYVYNNANELLKHAQKTAYNTLMYLYSKSGQDDLLEISKNSDELEIIASEGYTAIFDFLSNKELFVDTYLLTNALHLAKLQSNKKPLENLTHTDFITRIMSNSIRKYIHHNKQKNYKHLYIEQWNDNENSFDVVEFQTAYAEMIEREHTNDLLIDALKLMTETEKRICYYIANGYTYEYIRDRLNLTSVLAVKKRVYNMRQKLHNNGLYCNK